jgi:TRAP transporter 4TM/12TM fusion protein
MELESRLRELRGPLGIIAKVILIGIPVIAILYTANVPSLFGKSVYVQQYLGIFLALTLCAVYLTIPPTKSAARNKLPFYDAVFAVLSLVVGSYVALFYPHLLANLGFISPVNLILGAITIILIIEAARRTLGWILVILGVIFFLYPFFSYLIPGILQTRQLLWSRILTYFYLDPNGIFGSALIVAATMVLCFILFGSCLFAAGGGQFLTDLAIALLGKYRGGPAKISVLASSLFGTISGSASANAAAVGVITIPLMKRVGYKPHFAAGVEAVSGTGGCIMPPVMAAAAFLIAEFLEISYYQVAIAAVIPAILYYVAVFTQVHLEAVKENLQGLPANELPPLRGVLKKGAIFIVPLIVLVYCLFMLNLDASLSALYAVASAFLVSFFRKESRRSILKLPSILENTGRGLLEIGVVCMVAGFVVGAVTMTGLGISLSQALITLSGGNILVLLIVAAIACIILGCGMPVTPIYIIVAALIAPALIKVGIEPLAAHLFIFYFGVLSFITPPVCTATYVAAGIAHADPLKTAWVGVRLGIAAYIVPFVFAFSPALLLMGSWIDISIQVTFAIIGIIMISIGIEGFLYHKLNILERIWAIIGGLGVIVPISNWTYIGLGLSIAFFLYEWIRTKGRFSHLASEK